MIIEMTQNKDYVIGDDNEKNEDKRDLDSYKKVTKSILNILALFKKIKFFNFMQMQEKALASRYTQKIEEFIYIVYRLF